MIWPDGGGHVTLRNKFGEIEEFVRSVKAKGEF